MQEFKLKIFFKIKLLWDICNKNTQPVSVKYKSIKIQFKKNPDNPEHSTLLTFQMW